MSDGEPTKIVRSCPKTVPQTAAMDDKGAHRWAPPTNHAEAKQIYSSGGRGAFSRRLAGCGSAVTGWTHGSR
jgi:hypothetical protein